jgi:predicted nucleic acid-binding protein
MPPVEALPSLSAQDLRVILVDGIIAACAILNDVALAQRDRDFQIIAGLADLRLVDLGTR